MLVLTRRVGESIVIGDNIRVTIVAIGNGRTKIGIEAPKGESVDRSEIRDRKNAETGAASKLPDPVTTGRRLAGSTR